MSHFSASRVVALLVLLVQTSVYGVAATLDQIASARANAQVVHVEANSGPKCAGHDEAACGLCQVRLATGNRATAHFVVVAVTRHRQPTLDTPTLRGLVERTALHSRAPPTA